MAANIERPDNYPPTPPSTMASSTSTDPYDSKLHPINTNVLSSEALDIASDVHTLTDTHLQDAGLKPQSYYDERLPKMSAYLRSLLLPLLPLELPVLTYIQKWRHPILDYYFLHTASLGSHTFYVLMCPIPVWFGYLYKLRDFIVILGLGIYLTGLVKDTLCLPRPKSPPVRRITLSHYTAREYGCPSSHTANATGVCLMLLIHLINGESVESISSKILLIIGMFIYWSSMVVGRLYCGMHGLVDVVIGAIIGVVVVFIRFTLKEAWDYLILFSHSYMVPLGIIALNYGLVYFHPVPIDACPCFEDSVAFVGVLMGMDFSHWALAHSPFRNTDPLSPASIPFSYEKLGLYHTVLRTLIGVAIVAVWKTISKPLLLKIFKADPKSPECFAFKKRTDSLIIIKLIVYSGISVSVIGCKCFFEWIGLSVKP